MNPKKKSPEKEEGKKAHDMLFASLGGAAVRRGPVVTKPRVVSAETPRQRVSLCMIVKNEEKNLADCLNCVKDLVDEMIVVDTGSTDRTKEIATEMGAKVFDFPWVDSFAAARNESLRHATGDWIFWMDADDRMDEPGRQKLRALFAELDSQTAGYLMTCRVLPSNPSKPIRVVDHTRLFRNHPKIRWHYRVHEQILPSVLAAGGQARRCDVVITHVGYQDKSLSKGKLERNVKLMKLDHLDTPNDPFVLYNLGRGHERLEQTAEAVKYWKRSLECSPPTETYVAKLYTLLAHGYQRLGQRADMLAMCLAGLARFPEYVELLYWTAAVLYDMRDLRAAEAALVRLLSSKAEGVFALGDDPGVRGHKARHLLGRIYRDQKRPKEAEVQWQAALAEEPNFAQALLGIGQIRLDQRRYNEVDQIAARLEAIPEGKMEGAVLKGLRLALDKNYAAARQLMEETVSQFPNAMEPLILLGRILMRQKDFDAAETVVRKLLSLDPGNGEAQRKLARIQQEKGTAAGTTPAASAPAESTSAESPNS